MPRRATALLLLPLVFASCSNAQQVTARLRSTDDTRLVGVAVFRAVGSGTNVIVNVSDLEPGARLRGAVNAGTCSRPGASLLALPDLHPDDEGRARASGRLRFRGREDVELASIADGEHVVRLIDETDVACGSIPRA